MVIEAHPRGVEAGPKAFLDILHPLDERFSSMGKDKFKRIFVKAKELRVAPSTAPAAYAATVAAACQQLNPKSTEDPKVKQPAQAPCKDAGKGAGYSGGAGAAASLASDNKENCEQRPPEVVLTRPDLSKKFGMVIGVDNIAGGGHAVTSVRQGGVLDDFNGKNPSMAIRTGDVLVSVNGKADFDGMMSEFGSSLSCTIKLLREDTRGAALKIDSAAAKKEAADWEDRRARVTAALIPGLKKIVESEFGAGAAARISRVEKMYERIGRNEVFEEDGEHGKVYAPGYIEGLTPHQPWHEPQDYTWCKDLVRQWKAIRTELRNCLPEETLWTGGAYQASNEAYGADWKIMGVFTAGEWRDEKRFKVTSAAVRQLKNVKPFEVFFAKMPANTKIAPHSDNLNYILTSHLALELEEGSCTFTAGNQEKHWKEGEMLVVDTSYIHSCVNKSARDRYVLVFRFWHPDLSDEELRAIQLSHAILARASGPK